MNCENYKTLNTINLRKSVKPDFKQSDKSHDYIDPYHEEIWDDKEVDFKENCYETISKGSNEEISLPDSNDFNWVVKVVNNNYCYTTVQEVQCEIAFSKVDSFKIAKTIQLVKEKTLFIKSNKINSENNYLFVSKGSGLRYSEYSFLRVRLLATNFLGVKKHYERIYNINAELSEENADCDPQCQCHHDMSSLTINNCGFAKLKCAIWNCLRNKKVKAR